VIPGKEAIMGTYDSKKTVQPGQYPATAWTGYGLPAQDEDSGAGGSPAFSDALDTGSSNEPGQYPDRMPLTGTALGGSGAPGSAGVKGLQQTSGPDSVTFEKDTVWKSEYEQDGATVEGALPKHTNTTVQGDGDWTQANSAGYHAPASLQMPGTAQVQLDSGGDGAFQPGGGGRVRRGGFMNGQRG
jgi:hypothetical protein